MYRLGICLRECMRRGNVVSEMRFRGSSFELVLFRRAPARQWINDLRAGSMFVSSMPKLEAAELEATGK
jgi:hypothetical protein